MEDTLTYTRKHAKKNLYKKELNKELKSTNMAKPSLKLRYSGVGVTIEYVVLTLEEAVNLSPINIQTYPYVQERLYSNENSSSEGCLL
ncbi:hypothetical protein NC652_029687 [Populus alba x Populus x berolinensis]|nr:hypothetical protein NC652_029687 [Populus alba x Populus x berolinensis]